MRHDNSKKRWGVKMGGGGVPMFGQTRPVVGPGFVRKIAMIPNGPGEGASSRAGRMRDHVLSAACTRNRRAVLRQGSALVR